MKYSPNRIEKSYGADGCTIMPQIDVDKPSRSAFSIFLVIKGDEDEFMKSNLPEIEGRCLAMVAEVSNLIKKDEASVNDAVWNAVKDYGFAKQTKVMAGEI